MKNRRVARDLRRQGAAGSVLGSRRRNARNSALCVVWVLRLLELRGIGGRALCLVRGGTI
eukprot:5492674-Prymnesium_polylepis.1